MHTRRNATGWEEFLLRTILWLYISLCLIIAGLNWGYAPQASAQMAALVTKIWQIYENWIKALFIFICGFLTLRIKKKGQRIAMRRQNIIGLSIAALAIHIVLPLISKNPDLYFYAMPLPWSTMPLQAGIADSPFGMTQLLTLQASGLRFALIFYWIYSFFIFLGTLLFGRRLQCSMLCLFNGFAAEVFEPAIPLVKRKAIPKKIIPKFTFIRWLFFIISLAFTFYWVLVQLGLPFKGVMELMEKAESIKYLTTELLMAMFFWIVFIGRGYCLYCPLGTTLALVSRLAGQSIKTDNAVCIQCGQCSKACPVAIDVKTYAKEKSPVIDLSCIGCGHCIDSCPTQTLSYSTHFISSWKKYIEHNQDT
ncbi:4Fe-4S dicluster domain-containing protein [uncultured Sphaerochaeta sp.]|uniref:4Fe-4S binding protein n=1 Tax=uncultured Sphaerochaeta sp. TaxID=886478 RepID=UPI002A0A39B7|nr:4Fe-4S dicluster domain-containing protein [uncultured Sphaerochaeta sp.]